MPKYYANQNFKTFRINYVHCAQAGKRSDQLPSMERPYEQRSIAGQKLKNVIYSIFILKAGRSEN